MVKSIYLSTNEVIMLDNSFPWYLLYIKKMKLSCFCGDPKVAMKKRKCMLGLDHVPSCGFGLSNMLHFEQHIISYDTVVSIVGLFYLRVRERVGGR